jgi:hypothetical protein
MLFPGPLPEPVELDDLHARLMLLSGYCAALLGSEVRRSGSSLEQDRLAADALLWCAPYIRALIGVAERHLEEFRSLCPPGSSGVQR